MTIQLLRKLYPQLLFIVLKNIINGFLRNKVGCAVYRFDMYTHRVDVRSFRTIIGPDEDGT